MKNDSRFQVSADYDKIKFDMDDKVEENAPYIYENYNYEWNILGIHFEADALYTSIHNSRISNIKTVVKKIEQKKEDIDIVFNPLKGKKIGIYSYIYNPRIKVV